MYPLACEGQVVACRVDPTKEVNSASGRIKIRACVRTSVLHTQTQALLMCVTDAPEDATPENTKVPFSFGDKVRVEVGYAAELSDGQWVIKSAIISKLK